MVSYGAQECSCKQHFSLHCPLDPLVFLTRGLGSAGISWWCVIVENITKERSTCDRLEHCSVRAVGLLGLLGLGVKKPTPAAAVTAPPSDTSPSLGGSGHTPLFRVRGQFCSTLGKLPFSPAGLSSSLFHFTWPSGPRAGSVSPWLLFVPSSHSPSLLSENTQL